MVGLLVPKPNNNKSIEEIATEGTNDEEYDKRVYRRIYSSSEGRTTENERGIIEDDYYEGVFELIDLTGLKRFDNGKISPGGFDYNKEYYYEFYVEFEAGNTLSGFSDDPDEVKAFIPVAEQFGQYYKEYIARNPIEK